MVFFLADDCNCFFDYILSVVVDVMVYVLWEGSYVCVSVNFHTAELEVETSCYWVGTSSPILNDEVVSDEFEGIADFDCKLWVFNRYSFKKSSTF